MERARAAWCATLALAALAAAGPRYSSRIVDTESGAIRGVIVEPASRRLEPVEAFRGVPYAAPPARLAPPPPPPRWPGTRLADAFAPVCPQRYPDISNKSAALTRMPLGRYNELKLLVPLLANQSEDCLYLNIYVPGSGARGVEAPYAVVVWLSGGSFEWGTANALDGSVLAARAHLVVVTVNYRLGLLGFLTAGGEARGGGAAEARTAGSAAALDAAAALRWVRRNIASFGGDPRRVTLAGHDTAAALATVLLMMPQVKGLFTRALLMSGTALSSWALAPDAALMRSSAAQQLHCTPDADGAAAGSGDGGRDHDEGWLVRCVRARPLAALLAVSAPSARFLAGWAPSVPAAAPPAPPSAPSAPLPSPAAPVAPPAAPPAAARALDTSAAFLACSLAIGVATTESYHDFADEDVQYGFEEDYRNRVLRTYVRNVYQYHRNEIFAAVRNEYTDWDKPIQHPINIRDATLEALSDAASAAPALRAAHLHARRGARTHLFHFAYQTKDSDYPQRLGSVRGEALPYLLGLPLVGGLPLAPHNYSRGDVAVAESVVALVAAFVKTGDPSPATADFPQYSGPAWPRYELGTQQYLSITGSKPRVKSHYRGHKMALWLHLVPQLHRPGSAAPRHHHFRERDPDMYSGAIFPERHVTAPLGDDDDPDGAAAEGGGGGGGDGGAEECDPAGGTPRPALPAQPAPPRPSGSADLLKTFADTHYYSYTLALGVTVAVGCFLLALNVLIFAGIYHQRGRGKRRRPAPPRRHALQREGSIQVSKGLEAAAGGGEGRGGGGGDSGSICHIKPIRTDSLPHQMSADSEALDERSLHSSRSGQATAPVKKRVQIQEISV